MKLKLTARYQGAGSAAWYLRKSPVLCFGLTAQVLGVSDSPADGELLTLSISARKSKGAVRVERLNVENGLTRWLLPDGDSVSGFWTVGKIARRLKLPQVLYVKVVVVKPRAKKRKAAK